MHYQWDFPFLLRYAPLFWKGIGITLAYTVGTIFLGLILGLVIGLGRLARASGADLRAIPLKYWLASPAFWLIPMRWLLVGFVEAFRCTPLLVQIVWVYYGLLILSRPVIAWNVVAVLINFLSVGAYLYFVRKEKAEPKSVLGS